MHTTEILAAVASGQRSAREVVQTTLAHIARVDGQLNAFTATTAERALAQADALDQRRRQGHTLPPLAGLPFAVKNLFDIEGLPTLAGAQIHTNAAPATADAQLVQRLSAAGAILVGALNMDAYAYGFTTENSFFGPTHNPHALDRIAGGSSGGSGAAVAAGCVPLALGSDTNGSIRVPASLCGTWGLKPTFGRLTRRGTFPFVHNLDHLGPLADSVEGLALSYDTMQGPDALDPACHATRIQPTASLLQQPLSGLRIGILDGYFHDLASDPAREVTALAARTLGAQETVTWPAAEAARAAAFIMTASEGSNLHLDDLRTRADEIEPLSVDRFFSGALQPAAWYVQAQRFRRWYRDQVTALFQHWDVLIAPATPVAATSIGTQWLELAGKRHPCRAAIGLLTQPISFAGCPVAVAPMWPSTTQGLPIGVQLIAAPWNEALCLRAAYQLQSQGVAGLRPSLVQTP
ncbi:AtzE family amidohydrolase [Lampropedia puyangensis]|uniref:AtzE family amidohydrolase n=1 Tax=Lampropedia puyangensis TaxID=1330072 RepID=A0A4V4GQY4_9BURK|nr:AtzE family amidohydrolase [Lampropedia puyangensis]THT99045.1 AtzE family amidohydrolase [Lampropedia puyangensis]